MSFVNGINHYEQRSDGATLLLTRQYGDLNDVARGLVVGAEPFSAFGKISTGGAVSKNIVWPNGDFTIPDQTTGETISFVSTSAEDAVGGTGVSSIYVHYIDANLQEQSTEITLTGLTPVTGLLSGVRFIQCMHLGEVGSLKEAAGKISAYRATDSAVEFSIIEQGDERCTSSLRMVPGGKRMYVAGAIGSSASGSSDTAATLELVSTYLEGHDYTQDGVFIPVGSVVAQDNGLSFNFPVPPSWGEGIIIGMRVTTDKAAEINASWYGWTETV